MPENTVDRTKTAAYLLWEVTGDDHALNLWRCAEDIANYLARSGGLSAEDVDAILRMPKQSFEYISFVRHIAFRLFLYTKRSDPAINWFDAEALLDNREWLDAVTGLALIYTEQKTVD